MTLQEDTYTVMNPVGTLSNQIRSPVEKGATSFAVMYNQGNDTVSQCHSTQVGSATQSNGIVTGPGLSAQNQTFMITQDAVEERYVKGAF